MLALSGIGTLGNIGNSTTVNGATAILDLGGTTQTQNGGVSLQSGGTIQNGTLSSSGTFDMQSGSVGAALAGTGALQKTTAGTVTLTGNNTYTGGTAINAGTLAVSADNNLGAATGGLSFGGGTLQYLQRLLLGAHRHPECWRWHSRHHQQQRNTFRRHRRHRQSDQDRRRHALGGKHLLRRNVRHGRHPGAEWGRHIRATLPARRR